MINVAGNCSALPERCLQPENVEKKDAARNFSTDAKILLSDTYQDYLVVNLPADEVEECMAHLDRGMEYQYPRGTKKSYFSFMNSIFPNVNDLAKVDSKNILAREWPVTVVFKLDQKFRLQVDHGKSSLNIFLDRKPDHIGADFSRKAYPGTGSDDTFGTWLDAVIMKRGFTKEKSVPTNKRLLLETAGGFILMFIIALVACHKLFYFTLSTLITVSLIIAAVSSALFKLWDRLSSLRERTIPGERTVYSKK